MKQFKNIEEANAYINSFAKTVEDYESVLDFLLDGGGRVNLDDVEKQLIAEGYDLYNLVADGHAYNFNGHHNDGCYYIDELDRLDREYMGEEKYAEKVRTAIPRK